MLDKLNSINQVLNKFNKLEQGIILLLSAVVTVGGYLGCREYEAVAWENKKEECQAMDKALDYEDPLFSFRLSDYKKCREELYQMNYRGRVFN